MFKKELIINSENELENFAKDFSALIKPSCLVSLCGDLGAGKTTFVRFLVKALNIKESVSSPSYVLENIYKGDNFSVSHWDLYRLNSCPEDFWEDDFFNEIVLVEWADKFPSLISISDFIIYFSVMDDGKRKINIEVKK